MFLISVPDLPFLFFFLFSSSPILLLFGYICVRKNGIIYFMLGCISCVFFFRQWIMSGMSVPVNLFQAYFPNPTVFLCVTAVTLLTVSAPSHDTYEFFHRHPNPNCDCPQVSDEGTEAGMESLSHMSNVEALSRAGMGDGGTVPGPSSGREVLRGSSRVRGSPPTHIPRGRGRDIWGDHPIPGPETHAHCTPEPCPITRSTPLAASFPEPTHRLLHPCQLINRLSGRVSDIDHLIRTLSDQSALISWASSPVHVFPLALLGLGAAGGTSNHHSTQNPQTGSPCPA